MWISAQLVTAQWGATTAHPTAPGVITASSEPDGSSFTEGKILASFLRGFYSCKLTKISLIKLMNMCLRHRPTPWLHWNNTSGAGLCYSPPQKINEGLSIHHNSLATQDTDSSIILFLPKLAGTGSLCSSVWCVCIFPPLPMCQLFFQDGFWLSQGGTGKQHALSPGTPTLLRTSWVFCHWKRSTILYKLILLEEGLVCAYSWVFL